MGLSIKPEWLILLYGVILVRVWVYFNKLGHKWYKSLALALFWPITMLIQWFRMTNAVLRDDETMKEFLGKLKEKENKEK